MKKHVGRIITLLLSLLFLSGCHKISFLDLNSCQLPCWNGLEQGKTTQGELLSVLKQLPSIDQESVTKGEPWGIFKSQVYFQFKPMDTYGVAYFIDNKLVTIDIDGEINTTFGQMVDLAGEPDFIITTPLRGGIPLQPSISYAVTAIYPEWGISFTYDTRSLPNKMRTEVSPDISLDWISIFDPNIFDELVDAKYFGQSVLSGEDTRKYMKSWDGYGPLLEKYPPARIND